MASIRTFEDLEVWKISRRIRGVVYDLTDRFPKDEKHRLVDQLRRAAISSTANIAEGFGRFHYQENIQFCRQARGSLFEILDHFTTSHDRNLITLEEFETVRALILEGVKVLNGYLKMLQRAKAANDQ